jgi:hypothetical protein
VRPYLTKKKKKKERKEKEKEKNCQGLVACWGLVAYSYNPSYSGGRDQEDHELKPAWENNSRDLISKKPNTKKAWRSSSSRRASPSKYEP